MEDLSKQIEEIINQKIRPRTRVDGGDIKFNSMIGSIVHIDAFADCSVCPCCDQEMSLWIGKQVRKELGVEVTVKVTKHRPYFA